MGKKTKKQIMDVIEALLQELATLGDSQVYDIWEANLTV